MYSMQICTQGKVCIYPLFATGRIAVATPTTAVLLPKGRVCLMQQMLELLRLQQIMLFGGCPTLAAMTRTQ
jgi:hypothetical protein